MKKFLSLVLALIMTMSLVTVSAGAAEYKDFTDKDEIQYEEAVAVLSRLGIINGYSEGDFRPEGVLTRGAAAKIIVSLLIGPEAANNLVVSQAPYTDVPVDHTFAAVISYCKTAGIISGYGDGSFKPGAPLTGYAFSKMLMGALGYKANLEGFVGSGWTMQVAAKGNAAGLFDHISFKGNSAVTREEACQLALNTLKATMVEYSGGFTVSAGDATVQGAQTRSYKVSNQEFASHINNKKAGGNANYDKDNWYTVEFGEEHFIDLRMEQETASLDQFGRPSNVWSYKKVTIGTFPIAPDYTYTTQVIRSDDKNVTPAAKERALGLSNFDYLSGKDGDSNRVAGHVYINGLEQARLTDVADIADYTDNGTLVEVYIDEDDADWIEHVVVIKTQLMEVKRIASDYVTLSLYDGGSDEATLGYNDEPLDVNVNDVDAGDGCYAFLKDLKVGDIVAVVPVSEDHDTARYNVAEAYKPETVSGELTGVEAFNNPDSNIKSAEAVTVSVGGTKYNIALWNKDLKDINGDSIKVTYGDVKLHLDKYGNAMLAEDVGETSDFMVIGEFYKTLVNNRQVTIASGWDISGNKVELNLGTGSDTQLKINSTTESPYGSQFRPGDLVRYTNVDVPANAEWKILGGNGDGSGIYAVADGGNNDGTEVIKASDVRITLDAYTAADGDNDAPYVDKGIKFIYVSFDDAGNVDAIEFVNGVQQTTAKELQTYLRESDNSLQVQTAGTYFDNTGRNTAQACVSLKGDNNVVNNKSAIKAVVIKNDTTSVATTDVLYVRDRLYSVDKVNGENIYTYNVAMRNADGLVSEDMKITSTEILNSGDFARYAKTTKEGVDGDNFYDLKKIDIRGKNTSSLKATFDSVVNANNGLLKLDNTSYATGHFGNNDIAANLKIDETFGTGNVQDTIKTAKNGKTTVWVDLTGNRWDSADDLEDALDPEEMGGVWTNIKLSFVFNDNQENDNFRTVSMIVITDATEPNDAPPPPPPGTPTVGTIKVIQNDDNDDLTGFYMTAGNTYLLDDEIPVPEGGDRITVTAIAGVEGGELDLVAGTNTTVNKAGGSWIVKLIDKEQGGTVKVKFTPTYGLKLSVDAITDWTLDAAVNETLAEGETFSFTATKDAAGATTLDTSSAVTATLGGGATAAVTDVTNGTDTVPAAPGAGTYTAMTNSGKDAAAVGELQGLFDALQEGQALFGATATDGTGSTQITTRPTGTSTTYDHYKIGTAEVAATAATVEITITMGTEAIDLGADSVTLP